MLSEFLLGLALALGAWFVVNLPVLILIIILWRRGGPPSPGIGPG